MIVFWIILGGAVAGFALNRYQGTPVRDPVAAGLGVAVTLTAYLALTILPTVLSILWTLIIVALLAVVIFAVWVYFTQER